jgi:hypothetical protein
MYGGTFISMFVSLLSKTRNVSLFPAYFDGATPISDDGNCGVVEAKGDVA